VGLTRIELVTSALSGQRSNRLSYSPGKSATLSADTGLPHHALKRSDAVKTATGMEPSTAVAAAVIDDGLADDRTGGILGDQGDLGLGTTHDEPPHR
jgi:hypothetical protein